MKGVAQRDTGERGGGVQIGERGIIHMPKDPGSKKQAKQTEIEDYRTPSPAMSMNLVLLFIAIVVFLGVSNPRALLSS